MATNCHRISVVMLS